nr:uncharacterized protein LOC116649904 [Drosophila virilis]
MNFIFCVYCGQRFQHNTSLRRHLRCKHNINNTTVDNTRYCDLCDVYVATVKWSHHLRTNLHKQLSSVHINDNLRCIRSAFKNRIEAYVIENPNKYCLNITTFFQLINKQVYELLRDALQKHINIKFNFELYCNYVLIKESEDYYKTDLKSHQTKMQILHATMDDRELNGIINELYDYIKNEMSEFQERDSGWSLSEIAHLEVNINKYQPLKGTNFICLPRKIMNKKACVNVQNKDIYCFKWALISVFFNNNDNVERHYRVSLYKKQIHDITADKIIINNKTLNFVGVEFPTPVTSIKTFEANNPEISITVLGLDDDDSTIIGPYYFTNNKTSKVLHHIYLLLLEKEDKYHYVWIKNISRLLCNQLTKCHGKTYLCNTCLLHFCDINKLERHRIECNKIVTEMPEIKDSVLRFKNFKKQMNVPFVVYADFECILEELDIKQSDNIRVVQKHIPYAYSYFIKCSFDDNLNIYRIYHGEDCTLNFIQSLHNDCIMLYKNHLRLVKPVQALTTEQLNSFNSEQNCHICGGLFTENDKVLDHCHLSGNYRGAAHNACNLNYKLPNFFPIFFHNLSAYDCHLFVKELSKIEGDVSVIPLNKEFYISISKKIFIGKNEFIELRFLDSFRFMPSSLDSLASYLSDSDLCTVKLFFEKPEEFQLVKRKGIFSLRLFKFN